MGPKSCQAETEKEPLETTWNASAVVKMRPALVDEKVKSTAGFTEGT